MTLRRTSDRPFSVLVLTLVTLVTLVLTAPAARAAGLGFEAYFNGPSFGATDPFPSDSWYRDSVDTFGVIDTGDGEFSLVSAAIHADGVDLPGCSGAGFTPFYDLGFGSYQFSCSADISGLTSGSHVLKFWIDETLSPPGYATSSAMGGAEYRRVLRVDHDAPTSLSFSAPTLDASRNVVLTFSEGTDAHSGWASHSIERASATLSNNVCGTFGAYGSILGVSPVTGVTDPTPPVGCYRYKITTLDAVGNSASAESSSVTVGFAVTAFADVITGTSLADIISSLAGNDTVRGGTGNDTLDGAAGDDRLYGDAGIDRLVGGLGRDTLDGGSENDTVLGDAGNDTLIGGTGADVLTGGTESDTLTGGTGRDTLGGSAGADTLNGGTEADKLNGGTGRDRLTGGAGNDTIDARDTRRRSGIDTIDCGSGRDTVRANRNDIVRRSCERVIRVA